MIDLHGAYRPRRIRCQEIWQTRGWILKVYGIAYNAEEPKRALLDAIRKNAQAVLPEPPITEARYGVGFLCAHQGRTCDVAFVDWWENEDELHHHMFVSENQLLRPAERDELTACSWDLALLSFERDAWVESIWKNAGRPDLERYISMQMDELV